MASAFWYLEDGRGFARRWTAMACMLKLIVDELKTMNGAEEFYGYLEKFVFKEEDGDIDNGFGGFIRGNESIMFNFDLRSFAPQNRAFFWDAAQQALKKLIVRNDDEDEGIINLLTTLLDMHKRCNKREDPMALNHLILIVPDPNERLGPGW